MKLREVRLLIVGAVETGKISADVVIWIDRLRTRGWPPMVAPFDYDDLLAFVRDGAPNLSRPAWDAFLSECDAMEVRS